MWCGDGPGASDSCPCALRVLCGEKKANHRDTEDTERGDPVGGPALLFSWCVFEELLVALAHEDEWILARSC
jgi:hypothetical protein